MESGIYQSAAEDLLTAGCCDALRLGFSFFFFRRRWEGGILLSHTDGVANSPFLGGIKISV